MIWILIHTWNKSLPDKFPPFLVRVKWVWNFILQYFYVTWKSGIFISGMSLSVLLCGTVCFHLDKSAVLKQKSVRWQNCFASQITKWTVESSWNKVAWASPWRLCRHVIHTCAKRDITCSAGLWRILKVQDSRRENRSVISSRESILILFHQACGQLRSS